MKEKFDPKKIENYKLICEENLRKKGTFRQIRLLDEYKKEGITLIIILILFIILLPINYFLLNLGIIGELLSIVTSTIILVFEIILVLLIPFFILYIPVNTIYQNKKHLKMSKIELEQELEKSIEKQKNLYDEVLKIYNENVQLTVNYNQEQKEKIFSSFEKEILENIIIGESISKFNLKWYLFTRKLELLSI